MRYVLALWLLVGGWGAPLVRAQALTGTTGLVTIPTASMPPDGSLTWGIHLLHRATMTHYLNRRYHILPIYLRLGYLPFLEVGLRVSRAWGRPRQGLGDRMVSVRLRVKQEQKNWPALVAGFHDLLGNRHFHALYVVGSKHVRVPGLAGVMATHLGYASRHLRAKYRYVAGIFGGFAWHAYHRLHFMVEYDSRRWQGGVRFWLFPSVRGLVAWQGGRAVSGGLSYRMQL